MGRSNAPVVLAAAAILAPTTAAPTAGDADPFLGHWSSSLGTRLLEVTTVEATLSLQTPFGRVVQWRANRNPGSGLDELRLEHDGSSFSLTRLAEDPDTLHLAQARAPWSDRFERIDRPPVWNEKVAPGDPQTAFEVMAWLVRAECPCLATRRVDWDAIVARERANLSAESKPAEVFAAMRSALDAIDDAHCWLAGSGESWEEPGAPGKAIPADDDLGAAMKRRVDERTLVRPPRRCSDPSISYGRISNLVGYVRADSFLYAAQESDEGLDAKQLAADLDAMIREFDFVESIVVDLRFNLGGFPDSMFALASRLMPEGAAEIAIVRRTDPIDLAARTSPERIRGDAGDRPRFRKKVFVLTSRWTMSAGEMFALALLDRDPPVVRIGESTQGTFCNTAPHLLPNGWSFAFPNRSIVSAHGDDFEGRGLEPDVPLDLTASGNRGSGRDLALEKVLELLGDR